MIIIEVVLPGPRSTSWVSPSYQNIQNKFLLKALLPNPRLAASVKLQATVNMAPEYARDQADGFVNRIEKVAIVGVSIRKHSRVETFVDSQLTNHDQAGGNLGKFIAQELVKTGKHNVTAITRSDSTNKLPEGVSPVNVDYDDETSLVGAMKGHQALIITMAVTAPPGTQSKLIKAAAKAGVPYIMPNAWGTDPLNQKLMQDTFFEKRFSTWHPTTADLVLPCSLNTANLMYS